MLQIANEIQKGGLDLGIDFVFFDAEDQGTSYNFNSWSLGAQYWSKSNQQIYEYGILLDMVGSTDATFFQEGYSVLFANDIVQKIWGIAEDLKYTDFFFMEEGGPIIDDHYFVNTIANIPMVNIINSEKSDFSIFKEHHHTHQDNITIIDPLTLKVVGEVVLETLLKTANNEF